MAKEKYRGKYRQESARAQWWDYTQPGDYFITICTHDRRHFFGEIRNGRMEYSAIGALAFAFWYEIPRHAPGVELGEFVVMPNHIHGIITLPGPPDGDETGDGAVRTRHAVSVPPPPPPSPPPPPPPSPPDPRTPGQRRYQNIGKRSISSIVGSYKSAVTKYARRMGFDDFKWQRLFHDHIIRNPAEYDRIANYIRNNVANWREDGFFD